MSDIITALKHKFVEASKVMEEAKDKLVQALQDENCTATEILTVISQLTQKAKHSPYALDNLLEEEVRMLKHIEGDKLTFSPGKNPSGIMFFVDEDGKPVNKLEVKDLSKYIKDGGFGRSSKTSKGGYLMHLSDLRSHFANKEFPLSYFPNLDCLKQAMDVGAMVYYTSENKKMGFTREMLDFAHEHDFSVEEMVANLEKGHNPIFRRDFFYRWLPMSKMPDGMTSKIIDDLYEKIGNLKFDFSDDIAVKIEDIISEGESRYPLSKASVTFSKEFLDRVPGMAESLEKVNDIQSEDGSKGVRSYIIPDEILDSKMQIESPNKGKAIIMSESDVYKDKTLSSFSNYWEKLMADEGKVAIPYILTTEEKEEINNLLEVPKFIKVRYPVYSKDNMSEVKAPSLNGELTKEKVKFYTGVVKSLSWVNNKPVFMSAMSYLIETICLVKGGRFSKDFTFHQAIENLHKNYSVGSYAMVKPNDDSDDLSFDQKLSKAVMDAHGLTPEIVGMSDSINRNAMDSATEFFTEHKPVIDEITIERIVKSFFDETQSNQSISEWPRVSKLNEDNATLTLNPSFVTVPLGFKVNGDVNSIIKCGFAKHVIDNKTYYCDMVNFGLEKPEADAYGIFLGGPKRYPSVIVDGDGNLHSLWGNLRSDFEWLKTLYENGHIGFVGTDNVSPIHASIFIDWFKGHIK